MAQLSHNPQRILGSFVLGSHEDFPEFAEKCGREEKRSGNFIVTALHRLLQNSIETARRGECQGTTLERNQSKRALTKSIEGVFFLRKKPLGGLAFGVQLLWFRCSRAGRATKTCWALAPAVFVFSYL
jgi:hypothetical protein